MSTKQKTPFGAEFEIRTTDDAIAVYRRNTYKMHWQIEWKDVEEIVVWKNGPLRS